MREKPILEILNTPMGFSHPSPIVVIDSINLFNNLTFLSLTNLN